jgi:DNA invertase Pin-like site-specific DNA recombinase
MEKDVQVWTIKDNYKLGKDINSKVLAFAFGLSAEIERTLISQRTKEALARKRAEGIHVGRPHGAKSKSSKFTGKKWLIKKLLGKKISKAQIAKRLGVHSSTLIRFLKKG